MIKDNFFSPARFINLCRKDMVENWKTNLLRIAMLFGVMLVLFVGKGYYTYRFDFSGSNDPMVVFSLKSLLFLWITFGILLASVTLDKMKTKTSRLSVLMTPVTPFENFFSRWVVYTLVYLVVIIIVFLLADYTRVLICKLLFSDKTIIPASLKYIFASSGPYYVFKTSDMMQQTFLQYFLFQSFFVLGSAVWPRNSFIKTLTAGIVILFSYILVGFLTVYFIWGNNVQVDEQVIFNLNFKLIKVINILIIIFFILFNWTMAYFRFKESDIIH